MTTHKSFQVVITDCDFGSFEVERQELEAIADLTIYQCRTEDEVIAAAEDADGLLVQYAPITKKVINALKKCQVISRYGIGVDSIDLEAAKERGIIVKNVPDYCLEEVSDLTMALILACVRKVVVFNSAIRSGQWDLTVGKPIYRLQELLVGLIGFGAIARRVVQKLKGFGCRLCAYEPYLPPEILQEHGVESLSFDEILQNADIVSIHAPLTNETYHLFNEQTFRHMKETAYLINTSRGGIIDEDALYQALKGKWIRGAAVDVVTEEPLPSESLLLTLDNLIITPHTAFYSEASLQELQRQTARQVAQVLGGELPSHTMR